MGTPPAARGNVPSAVARSSHPCRTVCAIGYLTRSGTRRRPERHEARGSGENEIRGGSSSPPGERGHVPEALSARSPESAVETRSRVGTRTFVLDMSVLLSDPKALFRFAEHAVVLPVVVISELEGKRNDPEIGYFARQALRNLDELRVQHERLDFPVPVGD